MNKISLITGATSGIGKACAFKFAQNGYDLILAGRRKERLLSIKKEIESGYTSKVLPLNFDVQDKEQIQLTIDSLDAGWKKIDVLINNVRMLLMPFIMRPLCHLMLTSTTL